MKREKKKYSHIKKAERLEIAILLKRGYSIRDIAKASKRKRSGRKNKTEEASNL